MAFPKLLQKLFTNGGAGDKLRSEILPDMNYLPLAGGAMAGGIVGISKSNTKGALAIAGGTKLSSGGSDGAILWLGGGEDASAFNGPGEFSLQAAKGTYGQTGYQCSILEGRPDGTLTWNGRPVVVGSSNTSGAFPVGFIGMYGGTTVPDGWFRCDGSTIADMATNYPKLYAVLGTNVLPNYSGRYPVGSFTAVGQTLSAGLPNITATWNTTGNARDEMVATGAVRCNYDARRSSDGRNTVGGLLSLDASRSSGIYGASTTVQPPAIKCAFLIKHD